MALFDIAMRLFFYNAITGNSFQDERSRITLVGFAVRIYKKSFHEQIQIILFVIRKQNNSP